MKTHIDIDEEALATVQRLGGFATKREAVHAALTDLARRLAARQLLAMRGTADFEAEPPGVCEPRFAEWDRAR